MKKLLKLALLAVLTLGLSLGLSGCGVLGGALSGLLDDFDAALYVRGTLDKMYLAHYSREYLDQVQSNSEAAAQQYEEGIDTEYAYVASQLQIDDNYITDSTRDELKQLLRDIYSNSRYEVEEGVRNGDEFSVKVTVHPITIFYDLLNEDYDSYAQAFDAGYEELDEDLFDGMTAEEQETFWHEYEETWARGMVDLLRTRTGNIQYAEPVVTLVRVFLEDDLYTFSDEDLSNLDLLILKYY